MVFVTTNENIPLLFDRYGLLGSVKLRKLFEINWKNLLKLSTEHNNKIEHIYSYILNLTEPV